VRAAASLSRNTDIRVLLVGDARTLEPALARSGADAARIEVLHAPDAVAMDEHPAHAAQRPDTSLALAAHAVAEGRAQALVSAGNTGALLPLAARDSAPSRRRTAFAAVYPTLPPAHNPDLALLDVGANLHARRKTCRLATMGATCTSHLEVARPSVGLLNIGGGAAGRRAGAPRMRCWRMPKASPSAATSRARTCRSAPSTWWCVRA
jgi:glycerol-3-phosphate acyltransferase PlsX